MCVTLNQNNPLWVTFKHLRLSVGVYGLTEWRTGLYTPFYYVWTAIGGYRTRNEWMRIWQTYMTMKNPHYTSFFRHIQCEWSVSCTWDCTYHDTTPLNILLKRARTAQRTWYWMRVPQSLFSRTQWFQNKYTHKCVRQCLILFVLSHVLGCHDVLFDLCPSIPHSMHVVGARLRFLVLASSKPLLCHLCCLERLAFCGSSGGFLKRGSCRSLRVYMWTSEYGCEQLNVDVCCVLWKSLQACTPKKSATKHTHDYCICIRKGEGGEVAASHISRKWQSQTALGTRGRLDTELSMSLPCPWRGRDHGPASQPLW